MTKDVLLMLIGGLVAFLPFLGFPSVWDTAILVIFGLSVILIGVAVRRSGNRAAPPRAKTSEPTSSTYAG